MFWSILGAAAVIFGVWLLLQAWMEGCLGELLGWAVKGLVAVVAVIFFGEMLGWSVVLWGGGALIGLGVVFGELDRRRAEKDPGPGPP